MTITGIAHKSLLANSYSFLSGGHGNWIDIGSGLRLAQDVGAHRRKPITWPTSKNEMWTRAFFVLLSIDRTLGFFGGRPTSMLDEESVFLHAIPIGN